MSLKYLWNKLEKMNSLEQQAYIKNVLNQFSIVPIFPVEDMYKNIPGKESAGKNPLGYLVMHLTTQQLEKLISEYLRQLVPYDMFTDIEDQIILQMIADIMDAIKTNTYFPIEDICVNTSDVLEVFKFGVGKYEPWSFLKLNPYSLVPALFRHLYKHYYVSQIDEESGLPHLAHAVCNARMIQLILEHKEDTK